MIINSQAFNAMGANARRIWNELNQFQLRKPIDVIKSNNLIIIVNEPEIFLIINKKWNYYKK